MTDTSDRPNFGFLHYFMNYTWYKTISLEKYARQLCNTTWKIVKTFERGGGRFWKAFIANLTLSDGG